MPDRIIAVSEGHMTGKLIREEFDQERIMHMASMGRMDKEHRKDQTSEKRAIYIVLTSGFLFSTLPLWA